MGIEMCNKGNRNKNGIMMSIFAVLCLLLIGGCTKDHVTRGFYDAFRVRNDLQSSPPERVGRPDSPDYGEYERLKKERQKTQAPER